MLTTNPLQPYGKMVPAQPGCKGAVLKCTDWILYEGAVDLASGLLHGPIDFNRDGSDISEMDWTAMITKGTLQGIHTDITNSIEPL
jgi:hypothetical protein